MKALKKHIHIDSGYSVIMPNNPITMVDSDSDELIEYKIKNVEIKILNICENIKTKKREIQYGKLSKKNHSPLIYLGNLTINVVPSPIQLSISIPPLHISIIFFTIANPKPLPTFERDISP